MARGPRYRLKFRRRREGKTDYDKRRKMVLSGTPRIVVRVTNKHTIVEFVKAKVRGDKTIVSAHSNNLKKFGWKGRCSNTPALYLTSLLACLRAKKEGVRKGILDIGLRSPTRGSKVFACLKAASDAGLSVPHDAETIPSDSRISGEHIAEYAKLLSSNKVAYKRSFGAYLKRGLKPENLPRHFLQVKKKVVEAF